MSVRGYVRDASFLAIGAGLGIGAVYILASRYSDHVKNVYNEYLKEQEHAATGSDAQGHACPVEEGSLTSSSLEHDDVISEQLNRNIQFFGMDDQKKITDSFVVVVGLGVRLVFSGLCPEYA